MISGCRSHLAQPLPQPTTLFTTDYFLGTPLSGPISGTIRNTAPIDALTVHVTFIALENLPGVSYAPVGSRAVFFSSTGGGSAVMSAAELTRNATIADLQFPEDLPATLRKTHAGRMTTMTKFNGALPPGITVDFAALDPIDITDPVTATHTHRSLEIFVTRPADAAASPQIALVIKDFSAWRDGQFGLRTEKALFDLPKTNTTNTALVVPFQFDDATSKAVAILVQLSPGTNDTAHVAATTNCLKQVSTKLAATQPDLSTGQASPASAVAAAVQSLTPVAGRRSSLAFLADQTSASICEDLAMEADDSILANLVKVIQQKAPTQTDVGWLLDFSSLQSLAKLSNDAANGTAKMPAELSSILTAHTGEVGRHPSSVDDLLRGLNSRQELENRLLAENTIFLEDSSPASRVRAYDWLNARHQAPAGYDPLAPAKQRRESLERAAGIP